jgi:hypothetical protein
VRVKSVLIKIILIPALKFDIRLRRGQGDAAVCYPPAKNIPGPNLEKSKINS